MLTSSPIPYTILDIKYVLQLNLLKKCSTQIHLTLKSTVMFRTIHKDLDLSLGNKLDFLVLVLSQPNVVDLRYFKL